MLIDVACNLCRSPRRRVPIACRFKIAPFADGLPSSQEHTVSSIMLRLSAGPLLCVAHREGPFKGPARSAHGVEPALRGPAEFVPGAVGTGIRSEEHTSELQSLMRISYAVFCLKKKKTH